MLGWSLSKNPPPGVAPWVVVLCSVLAASLVSLLALPVATQIAAPNRNEPPAHRANFNRAAVGFLIAFAGAFVAFAGGLISARWLQFLGVLVGLVGILWGAVAVLGSMFTSFSDPKK